jgi:hypothetical protein
MGRRAGIRTGIVLLVVLAAAVMFAAVTRASDPRFNQVQSSVGPGIVDAGADVLYKAQWHYIDNQTLTHPAVVITVPDGWALVSSDPTGCTQSGTLITCDRGTIRQGDYIRQAVELRTDADLDTQTVTSFLRFYEGPVNPGRLQRAPTDPADTTVISADDPNKAGKCVDKNGGTLSTDQGVGGSSTSALVPSTTALCTPVSIDERLRLGPLDACLTGLECVSEVVTTDAPAGSTADPIKLTIVYYGTGLNNRPLIFNGGQSDEQQVPACTGPGATPDPCYPSSPRSRQQSVTWVVNWSGRDPTWVV